MDITVTIPVTAITYTAWLRTSYISSGLVDANGKSIVSSIEIGPDQKDAFNNFMDEAVREVLKVFLSRQGDVSGTPFEYNSTDVTYRVKEEEPILAQSAAIKSALGEDVKNAIFVYVTYLWLKSKGDENNALFMMERYHKLTHNIDIHLYKLHD